MVITKKIFYLLLVAALAARFGTAQNDVNNSLNGSALVIIAEDGTPPIPSVSSDTESEETCKPLTDAFKSKGLKDGTDLTLLLALPLTIKGYPTLNLGFFQLAAALMAIDHFNDRNAAIVPELNDLQGCSIRIAYDSLIVMDTGTMQTNAVNTLLRTLDANKELPNAVCGGFHEIPALELSVVASTLQVPMVNHRGIDHNMLMPLKHPFVTQVNPDLYSDMQFLGDYLLHTGRKDYIAVLYASNADSAIQRLEVFRGVAQALNMKNVQSFGYLSPAIPLDSHQPIRNISTTMEKLKASGYRTIVWISPFFEEEVFIVGEAAHLLELDQGDHFWIIGAQMEVEQPLGKEDTNSVPVEKEHMEEAEEVDTNSDAFAALQFIRNTAFLNQADLIAAKNAENSPFMRAWMRLNETFTARLGELNPISFEDYTSEWIGYIEMSEMMGWADRSDLPNGTFPPKDLFALPVPFVSSPPSGATNLYDAIMAIGLGACKAASLVADATKNRRTQEASQESGNTSVTWSGELLQEAIRSSHFSGASGEVKFGGGFPGSRTGKTVSYNVVNLFPHGFFRYVTDPIGCLRVLLHELLNSHYVHPQRYLCHFRSQECNGWAMVRSSAIRLCWWSHKSAGTPS
jgi:Receptor family ligand binding region